MASAPELLRAGSPTVQVAGARRWRSVTVSFGALARGLVDRTAVTSSFSGCVDGPPLDRFAEAMAMETRFALPDIPWGAVDSRYEDVPAEAIDQSPVMPRRPRSENPSNRSLERPRPVDGTSAELPSSSGDRGPDLPRGRRMAPVAGLVNQGQAEQSGPGISPLGSSFTGRDPSGWTPPSSGGGFVRPSRPGSTDGDTAASAEDPGEVQPSAKEGAPRLTPRLDRSPAGSRPTPRPSMAPFERGTESTARESDRSSAAEAPTAAHIRPPQHHSHEQTNSRLPPARRAPQVDQASKPEPMSESSGALGELVRRWERSGADPVPTEPYHFGSNRDERLEAPPVHQANDSGETTQQATFGGEQSNEVDVLDAFEALLDDAIRRDAERHGLNWGLT